MQEVWMTVVPMTMARPNHSQNPVSTTPCSGAAVRRPNSRYHSTVSKPSAAYWLAGLRALPLAFG